MVNNNQYLNIAGDPVSSAVQAATAIASTVANIEDVAKKRRFQESLALLSQQQQKELNDRLATVNTQSERLQIMSNSIVNYAIANETNASKQDTTLYIIAGSLATVVLTVAVIYAVKIKKS